MKNGLIAILLLAFAFPAFAQESILDRLAKLEEGNANINSIMATQARMKADVENIGKDVKELREELAALRKAVAPNATFTRSTVNEWGDGRPAAFTNTPAAPAASWGASAPMMYSSQGSSRRRGLFRQASVRMGGGGSASSG